MGIVSSIIKPKYQDDWKALADARSLICHLMIKNAHRNSVAWTMLNRVDARLKERIDKCIEVLWKE